LARLKDETSARGSSFETRANAERHCEPTGRRKAPPDDRLREAIQSRAGRLDCFVAVRLAMTRADRLQFAVSEPHHFQQQPAVAKPEDPGFAEGACLAVTKQSSSCAGSTRLRGRSPFGAAKARASIYLCKTLFKMDGRVEPGHDASICDGPGSAAHRQETLHRVRDTAHARGTTLNPGLRNCHASPGHVVCGNAKQKQ
jgi:hypothetical protein